jgi:hypothetical protein
MVFFDLSVYVSLLFKIQFFLPGTKTAGINKVILNLETICLMTPRKFYTTTLWIQSVYYFITAVWGLADIHSFMEVTGPKTDIWLVKTVSVLIIPISLSLICGVFFNTHPVPVMLVAATSALGFAAIDFYYTANDTIKWVYAIDGTVQALFFLVWCILLSQWKKLIV